jgi:hypothetical protein
MPPIASIAHVRYGNRYDAIATSLESGRRQLAPRDFVFTPPDSGFLGFAPAGSGGMKAW